MAFIYQKITGASPEQCLVLGVREALVYPFDVGDYTEIRIGWYWSFTNSTDPNGAWSDETVGNSNSNPKQSVWIGLKDSGLGLPFSNGTFFAGYGCSPAGDDRSDLSSTATLLYSQNGGVFGNWSMTQDASYSAFGTNFNTLSIPTSSQSTGTSSYAARETFRVVKGTAFNGAKTLTLYRSNTHSVVAGPYSVDNLRTWILSESYTRIVSGYVTTNLSATGNAVDFPNSMYFYGPWFNSRIRIHNLLVEKIS